MDQELKEYLDTRFGAIEQKIGGVEQKIGGVEQKIAAVEQKIAAVEQKIAADIEASETRLLTEFWKWGRNNDQRMHRLEFSDATTVERVTSLEDRVFALERDRPRHQ